MTTTVSNRQRPRAPKAAHGQERAPAPMRFLNAGDRGRAVCRECKAMVEIEYRYRSTFLEKTKVTVPHVLLGVCLRCDSSVSVPAQSTPRLQEARQRVMKEQNARISLELEDRLNMMASTMAVRPQPFKGAVCRYVLARVATDKVFARLVFGHARRDDVNGTAGARVKFRAEASLSVAAMIVARDAGIEDLSTLLRGALLAVDGLLATAATRRSMRHDLHLLAVGSAA